MRRAHTKGGNKVALLILKIRLKIEEKKGSIEGKYDGALQNEICFIFCINSRDKHRIVLDKLLIRLLFPCNIHS